jgi:hypothetical protein
VAKRSKRTDPHRPGAIVPGEYTYVFSYNGSTSQDGWPIPSLGINCELDRRRIWKDEEGKTHVENGRHNEDGHCCVVGLIHVAKVKWGGRSGVGETGACKCSVCGTHFVYGDVWRHEPSGEYIHLGHECAAKYSLLADRSAWEIEHGRQRQAAATALLRAQRAEERSAFLAEYPGLEDDLKVDHPIVHDIKDRFVRLCSLSEKQVELVRKLAHEARNPPPPEKHVDAPVGRVTFEGTVVSAKVRDTNWGSSLKITIKVETEDGSWLAWGTCPAAILDDVSKMRSDGERTEPLGRGDLVRITATLERGDEPHFCFMKRPRGQLLTPPQKSKGTDG